MTTYPMYCKTCGHELRDPEEDLHDPDGLSDVAQDLGIQPENEDAHLVVKDGSRGWRYFCSELGQITSIVPDPPEKKVTKDNGEGEGPEPKEQTERKPRREPEQVYDLPEEKDPATVLAEVVTKPFIGLNEEQIAEVRDWAEDYGGQLPPDILEDVLGNMAGVQKQTAALARQKYEVKLNRWIQDQSSHDDGPPIGVSAQPPPPPRRRERGRGRSRPRDSESRERPDSSGPEDIPREHLPSYRRGRRTKRRNDALDIAAEEAARQAAQEVSGEMMREIARYFGLPGKIIEAKIERDPDWAFEVIERLDIDIFKLMEPSEARKRELEQQGAGPEVDRDADRALEETRQRQPPEEHPMEPPEEEVGSEIFDEEDPEGLQELDDEFEEVFGDEELSVRSR